MKIQTIIAALMTGCAAYAGELSSPDGKLTVSIGCDNGSPTYTVIYEGDTVITPSPLGINTNIGDFTNKLAISKTSDVTVKKDSYSLPNIKKSQVSYTANTQTTTFSQNGKEVLTVRFEVSDNNIAFRYELPGNKKTLCCVVNNEATTFTLPTGTTTFLCPQMTPMTGFARTAPSYETHYDADQPMGKNGWGAGYTFPCLFKTTGKAGNKWILVSETGVDGSYCASRLDCHGGNSYKVTFPDMRENNGYGTNTVQAPLPSATPWRTITVGKTLDPIVKTTITWDVLGQNMKHTTKASDYKSAQERYGKGSWSWIIADDKSCNYDTQKAYIDFAHAMNWQSVLIDARWDVQIGRDRIRQLAEYGKTKGVALYLWYNSNGLWNDAPQTPRHCMDTPQRRRQEMEWMRSIGIRGIKVDFFGGDKQCTMQLYEDILRDAGDYGLLVIFHGCTLPRGWERMYPSYVASEAVRASENLRFSQGECDREAKDATFLPFIRNTVGSMDFGGSTLNNYYNTKNAPNAGGGHRLTSDVFALSTAVLFQSPVQHFAMSPGNLTSAPEWALDFMKRVPTTWEDLEFIGGYPGQYVLMARKSGGRWYVAGINAMDKAYTAKVKLPMFPAGTRLRIYSDDAKLNGSVREVKMNKKQEIAVNIPYNGGLLIEEIAE